MAAAPEMAALLRSLTDLAQMQALQIASALELPGAVKHPTVAEAERLLLRLRMGGVDL
jgi:hypothetical protein